MTDRTLADLHPDLQDLCEKFLNACQALGLDVIITETYRSKGEQDADYAKGRTVDGKIITNARGGESPHNCTLPDGTPAAKAFDFAIKDDAGNLDWDASDSRWKQAISVGQCLGLTSGSTFHHISDSPHMEMPNWKNA